MVEQIAQAVAVWLAAGFVGNKNLFERIGNNLPVGPGEVAGNVEVIIGVLQRIPQHVVQVVGLRGISDLYLERRFVFNIPESVINILVGFVDDIFITA